MHGAGPGGVQNVRQLLPQQVAQRHAALTVQTAGRHRAVAQHGDLLPQGMAELHVSLRCVGRGPVEPGRRFQKEARRQPPVSGGVPGQVFHIPPDGGGEKPEDLPVARRRAALVPQPQGAQHAPFTGGGAEIPHAPQIRRQVAAVIALEAVKGDADLM